MLEGLAKRKAKVSPPTACRLRSAEETDWTFHLPSLVALIGADAEATAILKNDLQATLGGGNEARNTLVVYRERSRHRLLRWSRAHVVPVTVSRLILKCAADSHPGVLASGVLGFQREAELKVHAHAADCPPNVR